MIRHSWSKKSRPSELRTEQVCHNCSLVKVARHEGNRHWVEFYNDAGLKAGDGTRTPLCEPIDAQVSA